MNLLYWVILDCFESFYRNRPAPASLSGNHRVQLSTVGDCKFGGYKRGVSSTLSTYFSIISELSGISAGICSGMSGEDIARICIDCKADIIVVEHEALLKKVICILSPLWFHQIHCNISLCRFSSFNTSCLSWKSSFSFLENLQSQISEDCTEHTRNKFCLGKVC